MHGSLAGGLLGYQTRRQSKNPLVNIDIELFLKSMGKDNQLLLQD